MIPSRLLLVEDLDAAGSESVDVRERAAALRSAGAEVRAVTLHRDPVTEPGARAPRTILPSAAARVTRLPSGARGDSALRRIAHEEDFELAIVASALDARGRVARLLPRGLPVRRLTTGFAGARGWLDRLRDGAAAGSPAGDALELPAATADPRLNGRGRLPLWDGDFVLVPAPLGGPAGAALLRGFARLAENVDQLDLVVLAPPQPAFERLAASLGVGMRVHFVGRAPRDAEWAWWGQATAAVPAGPDALSCGLVLRALAAGCPWIPVAESGPTAALAAWLARRGLALGAPGEPLATTLGRVLDVEDAVARAVERGRAVAAEHSVASLRERVARAIGVAVPRESRRAA